MVKHADRATQSASDGRLLNKAQKEYLRKLRDASNDFNDTELRLLVSQTLMQACPEYENDPYCAEARELFSSFRTAAWMQLGAMLEKIPKTTQEFLDAVEASRDGYSTVIEGAFQVPEEQQEQTRIYDILCDRLISNVADLEGASRALVARGRAK
jgi:hypothetical protein